MVCKTSPENVQCLRTTFTHFSLCSTLRATLEKSQLIMTGPDAKQQLLHITGFRDTADLVLGDSCQTHQAK